MKNKTPERRRDPLLAAREKTHGDFDDVAELAQALKWLFRLSPNWSALPPYAREAFEMKATKLARYLCGDAACADHLLDDIGYNRLILERAAKEAPRGKSTETPRRRAKPLQGRDRRGRAKRRISAV